MPRFPFLTQQTDQTRLPVALLSGFLGSGKTTLVNALLKHPAMANTAVAVNEFGEIPLDRDLIDHGADKTVVMANGCLCCNLAGDMEEAVMRLFTRRNDGELPRFDRLIIEPSGLADPAPIAQAILRNPTLSRTMRLDSLVTTVDALFVETQLARHPETRKQIALADHLVLTKTDIAPPGTGQRLNPSLRAINRVAPILTTAQPATLFPTNPTTRSSLIADHADPDHAARIVSVSLTANQPLRWREFDDWLRGIRLAHADSLLRIKAILNIAGESGPVVVQGVHHVLNAPVALDAWPGPDRQSRLVLIADDATIAGARQRWAAALPTLIAPQPETNPCEP